MNSYKRKTFSLLPLLGGLLLVACGGVSNPDSVQGDESVGTDEAALCADGTCNCVAPDCDALNWTFCGKGTGTKTCSWVSGSTCATANCVCSNQRWICP
ncbi:hypothetical protein [Pyxidicoccus sp. MSG2]|uniref:hypothetical protein n=1 Tax=Pyxidicoccus sp. MSG2 TaxID=2996790 RepID=UPI002270ADC9|nr:hypothetical protein [Pyxidicoccus sp. MSG2]MCY1014674.1 hypothetical protein [Pyxidicoccus sp. MSG2]